MNFRWGWLYFFKWSSIQIFLSLFVSTITEFLGGTRPNDYLDTYWGFHIIADILYMGREWMQCQNTYEPEMPMIICSILLSGLINDIECYITEHSFSVETHIKLQKQSSFLFSNQFIFSYVTISIKNSL